MSLFQSSLLTLALAFVSALASIAGYVVQIGAVDPSTPTRAGRDRADGVAIRDDSERTGEFWRALRKD